MFKKVKTELQAKTIRRLQDENTRLNRENEVLKKQLKENEAAVASAEKYRDEHKKAVSLLADARERYREAVSEILKEKKAYREEFEKMLDRM